MSAADRIEAIAEELWRHTFARIQAMDLRAIAAELRGAPALTEAERAFFEAACVYCERESQFEADGIFGEMLRAYRNMRALRTERTPSEGG